MVDRVKKDDDRLIVIRRRSDELGDEVMKSIMIVLAEADVEVVTRLLK